MSNVAIEAEIEWYCECGRIESRFRAVCPSCGTINSFDRRLVQPKEKRPFLLHAKSENDGSEEDDGDSSEEGIRLLDSEGEPVRIRTLADVEELEVTRLPTGLAEADEVFGDEDEFGPAVGSCILIGGNRGIGKSTFVAQAIYNYATRNIGTLYGSAEESESAVKARVVRVAGSSKRALGRIQIVRTGNINELFGYWNVSKLPVLVVDSIQAYIDPDIASHSLVVQMGAVAKQLQQFSADTGTLVICISHLTKDGDLAGPEAAQHWVDGCFLFEPTEKPGIITFSCDGKNRFGLATRTATYRMTSRGQLVPHTED